METILIHETERLTAYSVISQGKSQRTTERLILAASKSKTDVIEGALVFVDD